MRPIWKWPATPHRYSLSFLACSLLFFAFTLPPSATFSPVCRVSPGLSVHSTSSHKCCSFEFILFKSKLLPKHSVALLLHLFLHVPVICPFLSVMFALFASAPTSPVSVEISSKCDSYYKNNNNNTNNITSLWTSRWLVGRWFGWLGGPPGCPLSDCASNHHKYLDGSWGCWSADI